MFPKCELTVLVNTRLRGKTLTGRTPFEVCIFVSEEQWNYLTLPENHKKLTKETLVARFGSYGDAFAYAQRLQESKMYWRVLLRS